MIFYNGQIYEPEKQNELMNRLESDILKTLNSGYSLKPETVIDACDELASKFKAGEFDDIIKPFLTTFDINPEYFEEALYLFTKEGMRIKVDTELTDEPKLINGQFKRERYPLGVILHIAAGNLDVLPAYSVVEGLLAGNINILKLPMGDSGLSVKLIKELTNICPELNPFIYVFDVPSTETESIKRLADLSDAIAVWGGDAAVSAVRQFASINTKIISWGHKLSFAYAEEDCTDEELALLAKAVCKTNQTLCSSCQGIFLDTDSDEKLDAFGERFFKIFCDVNEKSRPVDYGMKAKNAINLYNEKLEMHVTKNKILAGNGISVIVKRDSELELSYMYRNVWIKKLPESKITTLHKHKNYLQTASVLTSNPEKKAKISKLLATAGVVRITSPDTMSRSVAGEAHDGTYALREYSRIVEIDE